VNLRTRRRIVLGTLLAAIPVALAVLYYGSIERSDIANRGASSTSDAIFRDGFESGLPGGPPQDACFLGAPLVRPTGWVVTPISWVKAFTPRDGAPKPVYPNSLGFPVPIGADRGGITAIKFRSIANQTVSIFWDPAQAKPSEGYFRARPASAMFFSISPCHGDVRPGDNTGGFLMQGCRKLANTGGFTYTTKASVPASTTATCKLEPDTDYYINVMAANPYDGLVIGETTCFDTQSSMEGCDIQARSTIVPN
jgi:hypothetical protein